MVGRLAFLDGTFMSGEVSRSYGIRGASCTAGEVSVETT
jgi:hypothetical protein